VSRGLDHRTNAWQAASVAGSLMLVVWPLDLREPGFQLTFGAAGALLLLADRFAVPASWPRAIRWVAAAIVASLAVELALLPVQAAAFSRVTLAGVALNLLAVPAMAVVQFAGMAVVALDLAHLPAGVAGIAADWAARAIVVSAAWTHSIPALAPRVPPPHIALSAVYYVCAALTLATRHRARALFVVGGTIAALAIVFGASLPLRGRAHAPNDARFTMLDVGQGDAILVEPANGSPLLVDTGGRPFGSGLDVGTRVVVPALWARGVGALSTLLITHGDPDHMGGTAGVLASLPISQAWFGIRVPRHMPTTELLVELGARRVHVRSLRAGEALELAGLRVRVLNPPEPEWERPRVRNDDSVVLEVTYGDVAVLLLGDVSAEVERALVPRLSLARHRILKVAHHGSRTSTSAELLDGWRPQLALISAGRGNSFGHPAPEAIERLERAGVQILRTDLNGEITIETDGHSIRWRTVWPAAIPLPSRRATHP